MTIDELIYKLQQLKSNEGVSGDTQVMCRDCVAYRDLCGPYTTIITEQDADDHGDCENMIGLEIVCL